LRTARWIARLCAAILLLSFTASGAAALTSDEGVRGDSLQQTHAVKVYPDGGFDWDYVKANVPYMNYVRDRVDAELYLLITTRMTGAGGTEYTITIVGQGRFTGMNDTLVFCSKPNDTAENERAGYVRTLKMALMRYVARTPIGDDITIAYHGTSKPADIVDRWDGWVFQVSCYPQISGSQVDKTRFVETGASADRVRPDLKLHFGASLDYTDEREELPSKTVHLISRSNGFDALVVKSIGDHWGTGLTADGLAQSYQNKKRYYDVSPAVEWSVFPYSQSTRRELALFGQIIYRDVVYQEMTIYNKTAERLWSYRLSLPGSIKEPWGTFYSNISWQQYFHDGSIYRLQTLSSIAFRVTKALSLNVSASYYRLHDQIDQPRRQLTDEEILLHMKSLASTYQYSFYIGLTYTFGSIYTNVVNPRFFGD
jgi:hypothetical protein